MRLITTTTALATLALATAFLGACTTDDEQGADAGAYCSELKTDKTYFQSLSGSEPDLARLDEAFKRMHSLAKAAPPAVAKPWATLDAAVTTIEDALEEAGITAEDLVAMQDGDIPDDVDLEKLTALAPKMEALGGKEVDEAAEKIADHAKDECGVDLLSV